MNKLTAVAFSPDGVRIASGSEDNTIRVWDVTTGAQIGVALKGHDWFIFLSHYLLVALELLLALLIAQPGFGMPILVHR